MTWEGMTRRRFLRATSGGVVGGALLDGSTRATRAQSGEAWPQFGYDSANTGYAPDNTGPTTNISEKWTVQPGIGVSHDGQSPAVVDGTVYVGSVDGNLYALDAGDGTELWSFETDDEGNPSPAVADGTVYFNLSTNIHALDTSDGTRQWLSQIGSTDNAPAVADDTVYVASDDGDVHALDASDGTEQWSSQIEGIYTSPTASDGTVYVTGYEQDVYALDASDGTEQWTYQNSNWENSSPVVVDGTVYFGSHDANIYALDASDGTEQWTYETGEQIWSSPAVADGIVYVGSMDKTVYALDASNGIKQWSYETGNPVATSSPAVADGTVYVGSRDNFVYALDASDGTEQWTYQTSNWVNSSPVVADDTVYIGNDDGLLYSLTEEAFLPTSTSTSTPTPSPTSTLTTTPTATSTTTPIDAEAAAQDGGQGGVDVSPVALSLLGLGGLGGAGMIGWWLTRHGGNNGEASLLSERLGEEEIMSVVSIGEQDAVYLTPTRTLIYRSAGLLADEGVEEFTHDAKRLDMKEGRRKTKFTLEYIDGTESFTVPANHDEKVFELLLEGILRVDGVIGERESITDVYRWSEVTLIVTEDSILKHIGTAVWDADFEEYPFEDVTSLAFERDSVTTSIVIAIDGRPQRLKVPNNAARVVQQTIEEVLFDYYNVTSLEELNSVVGSDETETQEAQRLQDEVESLHSELNHAVTLADNGDFEDARARLADVGSRLESASETAAQHGFDDLHNEIETLEQQKSELREEIETEEQRLTLRDEIETVRSILNQADGLAEQSDLEQASQLLESAESKIMSVKESAVQSGYDDLVEEIAQLEQQRRDSLAEVTERLQTYPIPDEIPRVPSLSVDYDALTDRELIGQGGNADVTKAILSTPAGDVTLAIKEPRMSGTLHTDAVKRMLDEAERWDRLDDHDHIVGVVDYGSEPLPWIAMEYMNAGHLGERSGELGIAQALWTAIAVTKGVRHAHRRGVAHLDLKPENVLFCSVKDAWDVPKVADWGLSKHLLEHSKSIEGLSPQYSAPEQFDDEYGPADDITDIYQLGAVFYELFTGRPPFGGERAKVMYNVLHEQHTPPSEIADVPDELDEILLTALAKAKDDRYRTVEYLEDDLQDLFDEW